MAKFRARSASLLLSAGFVIGLAGPVQAQDALPDDASGDEIVVTAQKRAERAIDVPISLTALGSNAIVTRRMSQADDLAASVPNLQFSATVGENTPIFALRGVSMSDFSLNQAGPVATYYDEVYKGNFAFLGINLFDLERIEVLRGPQGTLYGKNTTGGAINLIAVAPKHETSGYISAGIGNYARREASGALNLALGETLAARFAFTAARADGWFANRQPGQIDLNGTREYGLRASLLWEPRDGIKMILRLANSRQTPGNYASYSVPGADGVGAGVYEAFGAGSSYLRTGLGVRELASNYAERRRATTSSAALTSEIELGNGLALTSVTAWDKGSLFIPEDTDGSPTRALEIPYTDRANQISEDLRITSDWGNGFNFIAGAYYHRESVFNATVLNLWTDLDADGDGNVTAADCALALPVACAVDNRFDQLKHSYALYSDLRYALNAQLNLRGGLRYTHDDGHQSGLIAQARGVDGVLVATLIPATDRRFATSNVSGKVGIDWKSADGTLLFANFSRGYRGNGFNAQAFFDQSEASVAKPETINAFEVGIKAEPADKLSLSATGFVYDYRNQQFLSVNPANAAQTLVNLDRSRLYGGELEVEAHPLPDLGIQLGVGLLHARVKRGIISGEDLRGHRLSNAPTLTLSSAAELVAFDTGHAKLTLNATLSYVSSQFFEVRNIARLHQRGYALLGANANLVIGDWTVAVWGKNLGDKTYFTSRIDLSGFGFDYNHVGTPRSFGVTVRRKF